MKSKIKNFVLNHWDKEGFFREEVTNHLRSTKFALKALEEVGEKDFIEEKEEKITDFIKNRWRENRKEGYFIPNNREDIKSVTVTRYALQSLEILYPHEEISELLEEIKIKDGEKKIKKFIDRSVDKCTGGYPMAVKLLPSLAGTFDAVHIVGDIFKDEKWVTEESKNIVDFINKCKIESNAGNGFVGYPLIYVSLIYGLNSSYSYVIK